MPAAVWRRLRVLGSWPAAAGHPLGSLARAVSFDASGVLTVSVPTERWARELTPHLEALRDRLGALAGERIAVIVVRVGEKGPDS